MVQSVLSDVSVQDDKEKEVDNKKCFLSPGIRKKEVACLKVLHKVVYSCVCVRGGRSAFEK